ncbi:MAG: exodeoxyribonuclease VII small subunit [Candidatus Cloacimonetes bacterium]|nr:exodeoxyribonuclease VII small subunit [Candidatus Cloacimonadota bacterium]
MDQKKSDKGKVLKSELKFEKAIIRLEQIVTELESGVDELDKVVALFEEGSQLISICNTKLSKIENKIEFLVKDLNNPQKAGKE